MRVRDFGPLSQNKSSVWSHEIIKHCWFLFTVHDLIFANHGHRPQNHPLDCNSRRLLYLATREREIRVRGKV